MRLWASMLAAGLCLLSACANAPVGAPPRGPVAVWDLDDLTPASAAQGGLGELLAGSVIEALQGKGYEVVERQRLLLVLEELKLGSAELADENTRLRLGRLSGARWMVFGGIQAFGGQMRVDLRLVEVETGKVRKAAQRTAARDLSRQLEAVRDAAGELVP